MPSWRQILAIHRPPGLQPPAHRPREEIVAVKTWPSPTIQSAFRGTQPRLGLIAKSSRQVKQFVITLALENPHNVLIASKD
ncbi:hypothetical protein EMIT0P12_70236 [Pseudomonas sp. IT-P12]